LGSYNKSEEGQCLSRCSIELVDVDRPVPGFHVGRPPRDKGVRYSADPPTVEEIVAVMSAAGDHRTAAGYAR
jgi:hypothetical protein